MTTKTATAPRARHLIPPALWPPALVVVVLIAVWQLVGTASSFASLPTPLLVVKSTWADRSNLWPAAWTTTKEAVIGVAVAVVLALVLAVAIDWSRGIRRSLYPLMVGSQTLPIIVLAPLTIIWFGFGPLPKIALVALFTFFAVAVGITQGLAAADADAMDLLRTMGASRLQLLLRVRLPTAIPQFFTGLKVAITYAYVSAIVAELVGAQQGLGVYMTAAKNALRYDLVFGAVLVTALLTLVLFGIVATIERLAMPWRRPAQAASQW
jgi:ABC-type nitrate/sulfonate/bicarbonate transport system permease component